MFRREQGIAAERAVSPYENDSLVGNTSAHIRSRGAFLCTDGCVAMDMDRWLFLFSVSALLALSVKKAEKDAKTGQHVDERMMR